MRFNILRLVVAVAALGGCQTATHPLEVKLRADDAACQAYGFRYGSPDYALCRKRRDSTFLQVALGGVGVMQDMNWTAPVREVYVVTETEPFVVSCNTIGGIIGCASE